MEDHGGEVVVERTGPDGTVFKLVLPTMGIAESLDKGAAVPSVPEDLLTIN